MWDLKLYIVDSILMLNYLIFEFFSSILDFVEPYIYGGFSLLNWKILYQFPRNVTFFFSLKFCCAIGFLILIRGGTPRYRYDYLTKLGWLKFIGLVVLVFFVSMLLFFLY